MPGSIRDLEEWVCANGGFISDAVTVCGGAVDDHHGTSNSDAPVERGVYTGGAGLQPGSDVCCIPERVLISEDVVDAQLPFAEALRSAADQFNPPNAGLILLAAFLVWDGAPQAAMKQKAPGEVPTGRATASFFHPYYQALPADLSFLPAFWGPEDRLLGHLQGSRLAQQVKAKRHTLNLEFRLVESCASTETVTVKWEEYLWARCIVSSRAYALQLHGNPKRCLVPWADLLNHGGRGKSAVHYAFVDKPAALEATMTESRFLMRCGDSGVAPGTEVLQSYGVMKSNAALLLDYGFVLEPLDEHTSFAGDAQATLVVPQPNSKEQHDLEHENENLALRSKLWKSARRRSAPAQVDVTQACAGHLFSLLRVTVAGSEDMEHIVSQGAKDAHCVTSPISAANEQRAMHVLVQIVQSALARFSDGRKCHEKTDLKIATADTETAKGDSAVCNPTGKGHRSWEPSVAKCCLTVVQEEQQVLHFYLHLAQLALAMLTQDISSPSAAVTQWLSKLLPAVRKNAEQHMSSLAPLGKPECSEVAS